jgi:hypothetical protein
MSAVGRDEKVIRQYIQNYEAEDKRLDQLMPARIEELREFATSFGTQPKQKEVFLARGLCHLDRGAVAGANGERPVHHEFHVAGPLAS